VLFTLSRSRYVARGLRHVVGGALNVLDELAQLLQHHADGAREIDGLVGKAATGLDLDLCGQVAAADPFGATAQRAEVRGDLAGVDPAEADTEEHRHEERAPTRRAKPVQRRRDASTDGDRRGEAEHELLREVEPHEPFRAQVRREMRAPRYFSEAHAAAGEVRETRRGERLPLPSTREMHTCPVRRPRSPHATAEAARVRLRRRPARGAAKSRLVVLAARARAPSDRAEPRSRRSPRASGTRSTPPAPRPALARDVAQVLRARRDVDRRARERARASTAPAPNGRRGRS
jgi:hypothetical protein